jgi:hypothetical protein
VKPTLESGRQLFVGAGTKLGDHLCLRRQLTVSWQRTDDNRRRKPYTCVRIGGERCELLE